MQKLLDWSKAVSIHVLYGHDHFLKEANQAGKDPRFKLNVCQSAKCKVFKSQRAIC